MDKAKITIFSYNRHAGKYNYETKSRKSQTYKKINRVLALMGKANPFIIELGCGNGRDATTFLHKAVRYVGMDASEKLINYAKKANPTAKFVVATFNKFSFPKGIDAVVAFASLVHADKNVLRSVLEKIEKSLNAGGIVFLCMQYGKHQEIVRTDDLGKRIFYLYRPPEIEVMCPENLKVIRESVYPPSRNTPSVSSEMKAKNFSLRRDFAPDEAWGRRYPDRKVGGASFT